TFYASYIAGFVFGPPLAGLLTELFDVRVPFFVLGTITLASLLALRGLVIPSRGASAESQNGVLGRLIRSRQMVAALLVVLSFRYSIGVFEPLWAPQLDNLGASTMTITLSLTAFALPMLAVARWAGGLTDRYGARFASLLSALATVPLMASYGYITAIPVLFIFTIPHGLMEAVQSPGSQAAVGEAASEDDAAAAQGLGEAAGSLASIVGALTSAPLYDWLGPGPAWVIAALTMLTLLTLSEILDPVHRKRRPQVTDGAST
ncbi:MAG: MFS transporter, partial [Actinomycetota bacterium]|nr:MFS transporter [Actinomycetota bacterium]